MNVIGTWFEGLPGPPCRHERPPFGPRGTDQYSHQYVAMTVHAFVDEPQRLPGLCGRGLWGLNREVSV